jgi:hypothetical protein
MARIKAIRAGKPRTQQADGQHLSSTERRSMRRVNQSIKEWEARSKTAGAKGSKSLEPPATEGSEPPVIESTKPPVPAASEVPEVGSTTPTNGLTIQKPKERTKKRSKEDETYKWKFYSTNSARMRKMKIESLKDRYIGPTNDEPRFASPTTPTTPTTPTRSSQTSWGSLQTPFSPPQRRSSSRTLFHSSRPLSTSLAGNLSLPRDNWFDMNPMQRRTYYDETGSYIRSELPVMRNIDDLPMEHYRSAACTRSSTSSRYSSHWQTIPATAGPRPYLDTPLLSPEPYIPTSDVGNPIRQSFFRRQNANTLGPSSPLSTSRLPVRVGTSDEPRHKIKALRLGSWGKKSKPKAYDDDFVELHSDNSSTGATDGSSTIHPTYQASRHKSKAKKMDYSISSHLHDRGLESVSSKSTSKSNSKAKSKSLPNASRKRTESSLADRLRKMQLDDISGFTPAMSRDISRLMRQVDREAGKEEEDGRCELEGDMGTA